MNTVQMNTLLTMPNDEYRKYPAVSQSELKEILRSPAHYKYKKENPTVSTDAMSFGTMFHTLLLEPENFNVPLAPQGVKRNKDGKVSVKQEGYEPWWSDALHEDTYLRLLDMVNAVKAHPEFALIEKGLVEQSIFWQQQGILLKARPDIINVNAGYVLDIKTTAQDAREHSFKRENYKYNYAFQAYTYMQAYRAVTGKDCYSFYFMVVESAPPHGVMLYEIINNDEGSDFYNQGKMEFENALRDYNQCKKTNSYPCYPYYPDNDPTRTYQL
jgi:hypothetical protein